MRKHGHGNLYDISFCRRCQAATSCRYLSGQMMHILPQELPHSILEGDVAHLNSLSDFNLNAPIGLSVEAK
jgi:hypothetical protein